MIKTSRFTLRQLLMRCDRTKSPVVCRINLFSVGIRTFQFQCRLYAGCVQIPSDRSNLMIHSEAEGEPTRFSFHSPYNFYYCFEYSLLIEAERLAVDMQIVKEYNANAGRASELEEFDYFFPLKQRKYVYISCWTLQRALFFQFQLSF